MQPQRDQDYRTSDIGRVADEAEAGIACTGSNGLSRRLSLAVSGMN